MISSWLCHAPKKSLNNGFLNGTSKDISDDYGEKVENGLYFVPRKKISAQ